jgi:hypothetical protein
VRNAWRGAVRGDSPQRGPEEPSQREKSAISLIRPIGAGWRVATDARGAVIPNANDKPGYGVRFAEGGPARPSARRRARHPPRRTHMGGRLRERGRGGGRGQSLSLGVDVIAGSELCPTVRQRGPHGRGSRVTFSAACAAALCCTVAALPTVPRACRIACHRHRGARSVSMRTVTARRGGAGVSRGCLQSGACPPGVAPYCSGCFGAWLERVRASGVMGERLVGHPSSGLPRACHAAAWCQGANTSPDQANGALSRTGGAAHRQVTTE